MKKGFIFGIAITLLIILSIGGAYYLGTQKNNTSKQVATTTKTGISPTTQQTEQPQPTLVTDSPIIPDGWLTYKNEEYGFEISYPEKYKALVDEENLYGWPNAVVLIYGGGQSYDLPIEVWGAPSEYENKYPNAENLTVKKIGDKYITLMNVNFEEEVDAIINTFKVTNNGF